MILVRLKPYFGVVVVAAAFFGASVVRSYKIEGRERVEKEVREAGEAGEKGSSSGASFELRDTTYQSGILNVHQHYRVHETLSNLGSFLEALGASVSVVDFDNDGWSDVYITNRDLGVKNKLFRNRGDGTFTEMAEAVGLADVNRDYPSSQGVFIDFDNDGFKDLLLISYCPKVFQNLNGTSFVEIANTGIGCGFSNAAVNVVDYDRDGRLDLVLASYYRDGEDYISKPSSFEIMPDNFYDQKFGGSQPVVLHNDAEFHFSRVTDNIGVRHKGWTHAIGVYDINSDGLQDLWFATDYGRDFVYFAKDDGTYEDVSLTLMDTPPFSRNGMSISIADIDNDDRPVAYVSHINMAGEKVSGNLLWKWNGQKFQELAMDRGVSFCGWSWGSQIFDLDNDGQQDIIVTNGFISADPGRDYWYGISQMDNGSRKMMRDARNWPPIGDASLAGYSKKCIFKNSEGKFTNFINGTDYVQDTSDGRALALIDHLNNGSVGFVEANQKQPAKFYENFQKNNHQWIGFKLEGVRSNRDGWGTKIQMGVGEKTFSRTLQPLNGYHSQSEGRLHFGLGERPEINSVLILWPSGHRQEVPLNTVRINSYNTIRESTK